MSKETKDGYIVPQLSSYLSTDPSVYQRLRKRLTESPIYSDTDVHQARSISMSEEAKKEHPKLELQVEAEDRGDGSSFVVLAAIDGKFSTENGIVNGRFQIGHIGASIAIHFDTPTRRTVVVKTEKILEAVSKKLFPDVEV